MKFICPNCKGMEIEVVMTDCVVSETIKYNDIGGAEYGTPEIHDSVNSHYQCKTCGWKIPVEAHPVDDDALLEWLSKQPQNSNCSF